MGAYFWTYCFFEEVLCGFGATQAKVLDPSQRLQNLLVEKMIVLEAKTIGGWNFSHTAIEESCVIIVQIKKRPLAT